MKKPLPAQHYLSQKAREEAALNHFGEQDSLHTVLRKLTDSYILCQDCFSENKIPESLTADDFQPQTIKHLLKPSGESEKMQD